MPRSYRGIIAAFAGLAALFTAAGIGAYYGSLYAPNHKQYQSVAGSQGGGDDYAGPSQSMPDIAGLPGPVERMIANPRPPGGEDHEKRDLAAQEASALWAFWMVLAAFATFAVTSLGTVLIWRQVSLTREAVEDTGKATVAMERQNQITREGQRPWIAVELKITSVRVGSDMIHVIGVMVFRNLGKTAARNFHIIDTGMFIGGKSPRDKLLEWQKNRRFPQHEGQTILPDETVTLDICARYDVSQHWQTFDGREGTRLFYIFGAYYQAPDDTIQLCTIRSCIVSPETPAGGSIQGIFWRDLQREHTGDEIKLRTGPHPETR